MDYYDFKKKLKKHAVLYDICFDRRIADNKPMALLANEICEACGLEEAKAIFYSDDMPTTLDARGFGIFPYQEFYDLLVEHENLILMSMML